MTVRELINRLLQIQDKEQSVYGYTNTELRFTIKEIVEVNWGDTKYILI